VTPSAPAAVGLDGGRRSGTTTRLAWAVGSLRPGQIGAHFPEAHEVGGHRALFLAASGVGPEPAASAAAAGVIDAALGEWAQAIPTSPAHRALQAAVRRADVNTRAAILAGAWGAAPVALTALALTGREGFIAHLGHGRVYLCRDARCMQLTTDQTVADALVGLGIRCDVVRLWVAVGDVLVVCADGPASNLSQPAVTDAVRAAGPVPGRILEELVRPGHHRRPAPGLAVVVVTRGGRRSPGRQRAGKPLRP
jgi:hypothetical protein